MDTLRSLFHTSNIRKLFTAFCAALVLLAAHNGTLPAPLEQYRAWIELGAYLVTGMSLVTINPKAENK